VQHVSDLHLKFALRSHHVWKYGRHPICDGWDQARKKIERKKIEETTGQKYNVRPWKDKERNLTVANWVFAETTHVMVSKWKFAWCMVGDLWMVVLRFEFHQNRLSGFRAVGGGVEICPSPLTWQLAYTTAYKPWQGFRILAIWQHFSDF